jgi:hypothetical protein
MNALFERHKLFWSDKRFLFDALLGFLLLAAGILATYYANFYTSIRASNSVTDIILDNIPVVNVDFVFNEGALVFVAFLIAVLLYEPRYIPFALKTISVFFIVRSFFMVLTHLAPPAKESYIDTSEFLHKLSSGDDLFFSAHTGLPFLIAFIFWNKKCLRYIFLTFTAIGGVSVLLGHLHYSIDVFSALFISFGVFAISKRLFYGNYLLLEQK